MMASGRQTVKITVEYMIPDVEYPTTTIIKEQLEGEDNTLISDSISIHDFNGVTERVVSVEVI